MHFLRVTFQCLSARYQQVCKLSNILCISCDVNHTQVQHMNKIIDFISRKANCYSRNIPKHWLQPTLDHTSKSFHNNKKGNQSHSWNKWTQDLPNAIICRKLIRQLYWQWLVAIPSYSSKIKFSILETYFYTRFLSFLSNFFNFYKQ